MPCYAMLCVRKAFRNERRDLESLVKIETAVCRTGLFAGKTKYPLRRQISFKAWQNIRLRIFYAANKKRLHQKEILFCVSLRKIQNTCVISSLSFYLRDSYEKFVCCTFGPRLIRVSPESRSIYSCAANYSTWEFYSFGRQNVFSCKLHFEIAYGQYDIRKCDIFQEKN